MQWESIAAQPWLVGALLNGVLLAIVAIAPKKLLTPAGIVHAWILGVVVWGCMGWPGYAVVGFYFLVGSAVTRVGLARKEAAGIAEKRSGARGPENVWGSAIGGALCALVIGLLVARTPGSAINGEINSAIAPTIQRWIEILGWAYAASFCAKLSDTCASEIGKAYGRRTFSIVSFQAVPPGTEGAVSLEGTLAGLIAAIAQGVVAWAVGLISPLGLVVCAITATIATTVESIVGATWQEQQAWLTNEVVNGLQTVLAALLTIGIGWLLLNP
ncbi:MAG: DUF92 domain-containing protein [Oscillatoriales cyanobacterium]|nr:MAG: DUF92 domain-containing protein [Oscillatoriales cyanobacterium]